MSSRLPIGTTMLIRFGRFGTARWVLPGIVVDDTSDGLAAWVCESTPIVRGSTRHGRRLREVAFQERIGDRSYRHDLWQGPGALLCFPVGKPWSVWWLYSAAGRLREIKGDLGEPVVRWRHEGWHGLDGSDHALDVVFDASGRARLRDEAEFEAKTGRHGYWDAAKARRIRRNATNLIDDARDGRWPFGHDYGSFVPEKSWRPIDRLPPIWRHPHRIHPASVNNTTECTGLPPSHPPQTADHTVWSDWLTCQGIDHLEVAVTAVPTNTAPAGQAPTATPAIPGQRGAVSPKKRFRPTTTPSKLTAGLAVALILIVIAGAASLADSLNRSTAIDEASGQRGRMAIAAFEMYRALSDADAAAASAFLPGQAADEKLTDDYENAISRAGTAITTLAGEVTAADQADMVAELSATLPVYTGLIETARTYHRQGLPLGLGYLRSASALAHENMLPTVDQLQLEATGDLHDAKKHTTAFPWVAAVALVAALAWLVHSHINLSRRTKRLVNPGMVTAITSMLVMLVWLLVSWANVSSHIAAGHNNGTEPLEALSSAHIDVQQARSNEALTLIAQGTDTDYEAEFNAIMVNLIGDDGEGGILVELSQRFDDPQLTTYIDDAIGAARDWRSAHTALRELDDNGDYPGAVASTVGIESGQAGAAFEALDEALTGANELAAAKFIEETDAAAGALTASGIGFTTITVLAMFACAVGVQRRIAEYR